MAKQRPELTISPRPVGRKAVLTALRREGKIPAVLYGHGDPAPLARGRPQVDACLRPPGSSGIIDLVQDGERTTAMIKQVDNHPVSRQVWHLDLQRVDL